MQTMAALLTKALSTSVKMRNQTLTYSGVNACFQNGVAETEDQGPPREDMNLFALCHAPMAKDNHFQPVAISFEIY